MDRTGIPAASRDRSPGVPLSALLSRLVWLSLLPLVLVALWLAADSFLSRWRDSDREATRLVTNFATAIDGNLQSRLAALAVLAASPLVDAPARWPDLYVEAQGYQKQFGSHVLLVAADLTPVFNTRAAYGAALPALPRPAGHAAVPVAFAERRAAVGDLFVGRLAGQPMVALAVPVERDGRVPLVLLTVMERSQFEARFARLSLPPGWHLSLKDGTGQPIAEAGAVGAAGPGADDREFAIPSRVAPWTYALRIPAASHRGDLLAAGATLAAAVLGTLTVGFLGVRSASRRLGREVASLAGPAEPGGGGPDIAEVRQARATLDGERRRREAAEAERRQSEALAARILAAAGDGIYGLDREGRITFANPAACAMLGRAAESLLGGSSHALFHYAHPDGRPYPADECTSLRSIREGVPLRRDDEVFWHADGHAIPVLHTTHPIVEDGVVTGAVVSFVDLTPQRAAAAAREAALAAAERLVRLRQEFMANVSHEIRTPLHGILGFAAIGQRQAADPEKAAAAFRRIEATGRQLREVLEDILDFAALEAGRLQVEAVSFPPDGVAAAAAAAWREAAAARGLALEVDCLPGLPVAWVGDPERLGRVLRALLSNAVKFTDAGRIGLTVEEEAGELVLRVTDTGIGMEADEIARAFRPFEQVDGSDTRRRGGTGLGLAVAGRLVGLMGGRIAVRSRPGAGSSVEVRLPPMQPGGAKPSAGAPAEPPGPPPLAGLAILAADDDELSRAILADLLRDAGAEPAVVPDGEQAVAWIAAGHRCDLALLDVHMPGIGGIEAARRIRALAPGLPVLALTAHAPGADQAAWEAAGVAGCLFKPLGAANLVQAVTGHVAPSRAPAGA